MEHNSRVIALGFFDGVHLGHGALLRRVCQVAHATGGIPSAVTFDSHPELRTEGHPIPLINSLEDRIGLMRREYGIQDVMVIPFDEQMRHMPWDIFLTQVLMRDFHASHLVAGHDFHFGYQGEGSPERLQAACARLGVGCDIVGQVCLDGTPISSTYIRGLLSEGNLSRANRFLGHPHVLTHRVEHGKKLGSRLGFPTVNLSFPPGVLVPARGVYATLVHFEEGPPRMAVTNIGLRPTVEDSDRVTVEGYILDYAGKLYGQSLRMEFHQFLRPERKFPSMEALTAEVMRNAQQTRDYFTAQQPLRFPVTTPDPFQIP